MPAYARSRIAALLRAVDAASTAAAKGRALEDLAVYLFAKIAGLSLAGRNVLDAPRAHELDVAFWNAFQKSRVSFLDAILIVECKATVEPVGSADVRWFVDKLRDRGARHGILIALAGISGRRDRVSAAHSEIVNALGRDGIRVLLLDRSEVLSLRKSGDLVELLKRKVLRLTLMRRAS